MFNNRLSRRDFVAGTSAAAAVGLAGFPAQAAVDWKKFKGTKIEVSLTKSPRSDTLVKYLKEFEDLTGITAAIDVTPEQQHRQKAVIELTSGKPSFDLLYMSYHVQKRQFDKAGWLANLSPMMKDAALTEPSLTEKDFSAAGLSYAKDAKGDMYSLPNSVDYWMIYWNKDLFAKKNIKYPDTFDELVKAAEALTDPKEGIYGFAGRGLKNANVPVWSSFLLGYGGDFLDAKGNLLTTSPESIEAAKLYQRLLTKSAPPGTAGFNWYECQAAFMQGKLAMWIDGIGFAPPLEDPTKSRVAGKVGYGLMPKGPKTRASATFGDGMGIPKNSKNHGAAYLFGQWAVSHKIGSSLIQSGGGVPFRHSILNDPEVKKGIKMPPGWIDVVIESAKISKLGLPVVVPVTEYRDIVGIALTNTLSGADPATELKKAAEQFKPILEKSEKA